MPTSAPEPPATHVVVERPPEGLARGQYAWPDWGIALAGGGAVVVALLALLIRSARARAKS